MKRRILRTDSTGIAVAAAGRLEPISQLFDEDAFRAGVEASLHSGGRSREIDG